MSDDQTRLGTFACEICLEDDGLRQFAKKRRQKGKCDYCGNSGRKLVVSVDDVVEWMEQAIGQEWCDPVQTSPVDGGEYFLDTIDADELLDTIGFEIANDHLMDDLRGALDNHEWCEANWTILSPSKRWGYGWERFQHVIKHERRYSFWYSKEDAEDESSPDYLPPADMLGELAEVLSSAKLVKSVRVGTKIWRVQIHDSKQTLVPPERFTSPPIQFATQPNRMSPPGVPMFYGADTFATARIEIADPTDPTLKGKSVSGVKFKNVVPLNLLDLTSVPPLPSYFSPNGPIRRHFIQFLKAFVAELAKPIIRDERQHIEYVPTQVFTEFVRYIMKGPKGSPIHGIRYSSSKNGKPCCVIFAAQDECLPSNGNRRARTQLLAYVPGSIKTVKT